MKKGISPVIATVILVAVTLAIAVAIIGWLFGLWGSLAGGTPQVAIPTASLYLNTTTGYLNATFYLKNSGAGSDKIIQIDVQFGGSIYKCDLTSNVKTTGTLSFSNRVIIVPANSAGWVEVVCATNKTLNPALYNSATVGASAVLIVKFEKSGNMPINVVIYNGTAKIS